MYNFNFIFNCLKFVCVIEVITKLNWINSNSTGTKPNEFPCMIFVFLCNSTLIIYIYLEYFYICNKTNYVYINTWKCKILKDNSFVWNKIERKEALNILVKNLKAFYLFLWRHRWWLDLTCHSRDYNHRRADLVLERL